MIAWLLVLTVVFSSVGCGKTTTNQSGDPSEKNGTGDKNNTNESVEAVKDKDDVTIDILQYKVEIVEQLDALIEDFEAVYPYIDVKIDTVGGGQSYGDALKARMNSGSEPDVFNIGGPVDLDLWFDFLEPLTNQPWVNHAYQGTLDMVTIDNEVYGQPYSIEGYGLMINVDMFEQAGIDPSSVTSLSSLREVFSTLDSKKEELGIDTVLSFSIGGSAWWTAAIHAINLPFAHQEDPMAFVEGIYDGTQTIAGNDRFVDFLNLLDLYFEYTYEDVMNVSYDDQVGNFALEKTAVLHQGNWTIGMLNEINPELNLAYLPIPLNDDPSGKNDTIPVGVPMYWTVNKNATDDKKEAAKLFLDYIASTERGAKFLVEDCSFIPPFSNVTLAAKDMLSAAIQDYSAAGKTVPWMWMYAPDGFTDPGVKETIQKYYVGELDKDSIFPYLDEVWKSLE